MLQDLPNEILQQVASHLSTASAVVNLSSTNQKLHRTLAADDYAIFRPFVQSRFPSIGTSTYWRSEAQILTSRSRAWDRRAFAARICQPEQDDSYWPTRIEPKQKFGYMPVLDCYEGWSSSKDRREVLAWGAAGRLRLRITESGKNTSWRTLRTEGDHQATKDILDVRLLRPHQRVSGVSEQIIFRRADKDVVLVEATDILDNPAIMRNRGEGTRLKLPQSHFAQRTRYAPDANFVDCLDVNEATEPLLAVCNTKTIQLFTAQPHQAVTQASNTFHLDQNFLHKHRKRCAKFLSDENLAVSVQLLDGHDHSPIDIYQVTPHGLVSDTVAATHSLQDLERRTRGRHCANTISPLSATASLAGRPGSMLLSGWSDGVARLHDLRTPSRPVAEYQDAVDDGQILSLLVTGHERFLAGSHHNAILKTFDLRMPGSRAYSYLDAEAPVPNLSQQSSDPLQNPTPPPSREINIFLSPHIPPTQRLWQPLPRRQDTRLPRYRGSIYSLCAPSPSSPRVYAGIENHVIQLDFISTDDLTGTGQRSFDFGLGYGREDRENALKRDEILNLPCYERPRPGHESTDAILLRKQVDFPGKGKVWPGQWYSANDSKDGKAELGWDERWRLATYDRQSGSGPGWRAV